MFVYELSGCGFESSCSHLHFRLRACFNQWVPWHSGNYRVWIHSETRTRYDKNIEPMDRTDNYSQHRSIIWPVWLNGCVFVYELSGCGFESSCIHLHFRFRACFEQGAPWHSDTIECGSTLESVRDMIRTWSQCTVQISTHNTAQSFGQFG